MSYISRYCKGISETDEKELRLFAARRKEESLGKGMVVKFVLNTQFAENTKEGGNSTLILPSDEKNNLLVLECTQVKILELILRGFFNIVDIISVRIFHF